MENQNEPVITTITSTIPVYAMETGEAILVEPGLTLEDPDNDSIILATVTIEDYESGETLAFTPQDNGVSGSFDTGTGVLTFVGRESVGDYQSILRTVTFQIVGADAGRKKPIKKSTTPKAISFAVYDIDFTNPQVTSKTINLFVNTPPVIAPEPISTPAGATKVINLLDITSDADGNLNNDLFSIISQPISGAVASIEVVSSTVVNLNLDYTGITFSGTDQLTIRACDDAGACTESVLSVDVEVFAEMEVYNAVAPNSTGDNRFMRILGIPEDNTVKIYNRWGDLVFEAENYQNTLDGNTFKGDGKGGSPLASGTYYYTIEVPGKKAVSGYLTLKQ
jgi:gliding motility-associated-like protein